MPLRDHFRPPVSHRASWEELHGMWPARIVLQLRAVLPQGYVAGPKIHAGSRVVIDVATFEHDEAPRPRGRDAGGGVATVAWAPPEPTAVIETEVPDDDEYEVRIYDAERGRQLVAAIELVSPGNKDRPEKRNAFVGKCAALLRNGVAVSIIDVVTTRQANLYAELLRFLGRDDPSLGDPPPGLYAVSCRWRPLGRRMALQAWSHALEVGRPLPTIPLWLAPDLAVPLDLEAGYEQSSHDLWIE